MYISRIVIRNFRNFESLDLVFQERTTCILGENNAGKSNLMYAIRLAIDAKLSNRCRQLLEHDFTLGVDFTVPTQVIISLELSDYVGHDDEAHLHPQLQRVLYQTLERHQSQTILSTHSTYISSAAPLHSIVCLTRVDGGRTNSAALASHTALTQLEVADLERYLDATRSSLLYAKKVVLIEGPTELFLISALVKVAMNLDLDQMGITLVPIHGTHFGSYAKLFSPNVLPKRCAIIADGDVDPDDLPAEGDGADDEGNVEDEVELELDLAHLNTDLVQVFQCETTFERAFTVRGTLAGFQIFGRVPMMRFRRGGGNSTLR